MMLFLALFVILGCNEQRGKPRVKPNKPGYDVVVDIGTVVGIHKQSALARAGAYEKLADAVQAGSVTTVNDAVNFMNPLITDAGKNYTKEINALRKERLGGAEDQLPPDAADVFRQFAKEYRDAAK